MNSLRALKIILLAAIIVATVAAKIAMSRAAAEPNSYEVQTAVANILTRDGFTTSASYRSGFIVQAERQDCHVQIFETVAEGYNLDAIKKRASQTTNVYLVYQGELLSDYPTFRIVVAKFWNRMKGRLGLPSDWSPPLSIVASRDCQIASLPWRKLADIRANL